MQRHGNRKHNNPQSRSRAQRQRSTDLQLSRAVTRFSGKWLNQNANLENAGVKHNPVLSLNRRKGPPRMTPGLPATYSPCKCSSEQRQLQGDEGSAVALVQDTNIVFSSSIWPLATRDDPRPVAYTVISILRSAKLWFTELPRMTPGLLSKRTICVAKYIYKFQHRGGK